MSLFGCFIKRCKLTNGAFTKCVLLARLRRLTTNNIFHWAVVVAQLVERALPISEVCGSNPVIGKNLYLY